MFLFDDKHKNLIDIPFVAWPCGAGACRTTSDNHRYILNPRAQEKRKEEREERKGKYIEKKKRDEKKKG